jgi:glutaredoxin 3
MAKVTIYSTTTCPYCVLEKDYLKSKGVEFEEILVDQHPEQLQKFLEVCDSRAVPCTHIVYENGKEAQILGFNKQQIDAALGIS